MIQEILTWLPLAGHVVILLLLVDGLFSPPRPITGIYLWLTFFSFTFLIGYFYVLDVTKWYAWLVYGLPWIGLFFIWKKVIEIFDAIFYSTITSALREASTESPQGQKSTKPADSANRAK